MRAKILVICLVALFIGTVAYAECDIDPQALYNWQIERKAVVKVSGRPFLAIKLINPDKDAVVKTAMAFCDLPTGIIFAFQYELNGIKRTFEIDGDSYTEVLGKNKKLI